MLQDALGLVRPEGIERQLGAERQYLSIETIGEHEADVTIVFTFPDDSNRFDQGDVFAEHPLVKLLPQSQARQVM